ncbi:MAG: molybdenum cofactor guanylyltransferase [Janthinobacterium lividum]
MTPPVLGYVLAGGESSRMQRSDLPADKALLVFGGKTLLQRALATLGEVCSETAVLCGTAERCLRLQSDRRTVPDRVPGMGPVGGLDAALQDAAERGASWVLLVPVDLPWMSAAVLQEFLHHGFASGAAAACMRDGGFVQPLPALVSVAAQPIVRDALSADHRKLLPLLREIAQQSRGVTELCVVEAEQLAAASGKTFRNVNTPEDLLAAQQDETSGYRLHQSKHGG